MSEYERRLESMAVVGSMSDDIATYSRDRRWDTEMQRWVYPGEVESALDAARLAIDEYYNGDRAWAERWLIKAHEANQEQAK